MSENAINQVFRVADEASGMRLEYFLARQYPQASRVALRRAVADGLVLINSRKLRLKYRLRKGDIIEVATNPIPHPAFVPEPIPVQVVFEDAHLLVVDKPAGMLVHPNRAVTTGTLLNAICYHLRRHDPGSRPGLIHRLDRQTSGLMVVAKTEQAHRVLAKHFRQRMVEKKYLALAYGEVGRDSFEVRLPIGWVPEVYPHWQITSDGREAITRLRVVERVPGYTMLEAQPKTGRTHQIRIHLAAIGHPIVGDVIYGKEQIGSFRPLIEKHGLPFDRHCLHASSLRFNHPRSGESLAFSSQLPDDWPAVVEKIRAAPTRSVQ